MPLILGGLGVGGCSRIRHAAHWSSSADCLEMVKDRHPQVAENIIRGMNMAHGHMAVVEESVRGSRHPELGSPGRWVEARTRGTRAGALPSRPQVAEIRFRGGARTPPRQCRVAPTVSQRAALVKSQSGLLSSVPFTTVPIHACPSWILSNSVCCCSAFSVCPCFSLFALVGVAVHSTLLATTAQRAAQEGSGQEVFCSRECHRSDISGGRGQCVHERDGEAPCHRATTQK